MENSLRQQTIQTDEDRVKDDIWYLDTFTIIQDALRRHELPIDYKGHNQPVLDFTPISDSHIREEFKAYCAYVLQEHIQSPKTFLTVLWQYRHVIEYLDYRKLTGSILHYKEQALRDDYRHYLQHVRHFAVKMHLYAIKENQVRKHYIEDMDTVCMISRFYHYIDTMQYEGLEEQEKDIWDVLKLPIPVTLQASRPRHIINFTRITQPHFRSVAKAYIFERLKYRKLSCVLDDMKALNLFSSYLAAYYPKIDSLSTLTRKNVLDYFAYIDTLGFALTTRKSRKGCLCTFLKTAHFLGLPDVPDLQLVFRKDYRKRIRLDYRIIEEQVLTQLNEYLPELPPIIQRITIILEHIGMRISDLCMMQYDCLKKDSEGYDYLEYYQPKTKHYNRIPVSTAIATVIRTQQQEAVKAYPQTKYLFPSDGSRPIGQDTFSYYINRLAYYHQIKDSSGRLFRIKSHMFRHTVATRMAEAGMSATMIRDMLGHKSLRSVASYIEFRDIDADKKLKAFLAKENEDLQGWIQGKATASTPQQIPLPNGFCTKSGDLCEAAFICYSCGMFLMDEYQKKGLSHFLQQLDKQITQARYNGQERKVELYTKLKDSIAAQLQSTIKGKKNEKDR